MRDSYETTYTFETANFTLELALAPEDISPRDCFDMDEESFVELCDKIDSGVYLWFVARVRVLMNGHELASDYLGGCCYSSPDEFRRDGYFYDMARNALSEARKTLNNAPKMRAA